MIPGLYDVQFSRLGGIHHKLFIRAPKLLDHQLRLKHRPGFRFAGQMAAAELYQDFILPPNHRFGCAIAPHHRRGRCRYVPANEY